MRIGSLAGLAAGGLVVVALAAAGILYAADYGLEASVVGKQCQGSTSPFPLAANTVTVKTRILGIEYTAGGLGDAECRAVDGGNFVVYHVRSGRTLLYDREGGTLCYDSAGAVSASAASCLSE